ncbi:MAG: PHP domain-containing protein [Candidatus Cloacimonadota bacterium]|nr:MAG: PHP domain-containing protein [Candidatus Cloacimonadota bacterium]
MLEEFKGDLHVHTCLSPCGDFSMLPALIIMKAKERDLDIIGICDHNSTENVMAVKKVGTMEGVTVIGGIEITSQEEVHILALFDDDADLQRIQNIVYEHLPGVNDEDAFGEQLIVDEKDEILGFNERLLIGATTLFLEQVVDIIHQLGGIAIAAHVDRDAFSVIGQLGFIPEGLDVDGLEISPRNSVEDIRVKFPQVNDYPLVSFSDAHYLEDIGKRATSFLIEKPSIEELNKAFREVEGRKILGM